MSKKLLIIGAGPTSALIAYNISCCPKLKKILDVHIWDKARGAGGRFSTSRNPNNDKCRADLGGQYLTHATNVMDVDTKKYYDNLLANNVIKKIDTTNIPGFQNDPSKIHYVSTTGMASVVKHFFNKAELKNNISFNTHVGKITTNDNKLKVDLLNNENFSLFDIVISTIPPPQLIQVGIIDELLKDNVSVKSALSDVDYTCRYALGLFFDKEMNEMRDANVHPLNFVQDPVIRFWSLENLKRAAGVHADIAGPTSIVVHTSTDFGKAHLEDTPDSQKTYLEDKTIEKIEFVRSLPPPSFVKCHKWKFSQVKDCYKNAPGCVTVLENPLLILAGDGMAGSGFQGCALSAEKTVQCLQAKLL